MGEFKGTVGGVAYADREEFEKAARDAGYRLGMNRTGDLRVGLPVSVRFDDGTIATGQVWAKGPEPRCGFVWLALDTPAFARLFPDSGRVELLDGKVGKVAA